MPVDAICLGLVGALFAGGAWLDRRQRRARRGQCDGCGRVVPYLEPWRECATVVYLCPACHPEGAV